MQAMEEELKMLRSGVAVLLHRTTPVPGANAQLRRFCADLGRLLVAARTRATSTALITTRRCSRPSLQGGGRHQRPQNYEAGVLVRTFAPLFSDDFAAVGNTTSVFRVGPSECMILGWSYNNYS